MPFLRRTTKPQLCLALAFIALLLLACYAFAPGLHGALIFDDIPNLQPWGEVGDLNSLHRILAFSISGTGFPGRPLSLLSFVVDDQSWMPDIHALKRSNLAIHLLNSCLVFWLALKLLQHLLPKRSETYRGICALMVAAVWSLHPIQVSNVSYIIQRMNLLSTFFELCGILLFMHGREVLAHSLRRGLVYCSLAIGLFMPLAVLAKENGLLLCLFVLIIEWLCFAPQPRRLWRLWKAVFLWLPLLAFGVYCLVTFRAFTVDYPTRNFNAWERLLTEGPVLVDYLNKLLLPRLQGSGLYFDNFPVSRSLLQPVSTLFSWLGLLLLIASAVWMRKRLPLFSFGILFYFGGHLMESTLLPLELYFEHRNYLPQLGLWLAVAGLIERFTSARLKIPLMIAAVALLAALLLMTRNNASLWGNPETQTMVWYRDNPDSVRNTLSYANLLLQKNRYDDVQQVLAATGRQNPENMALLVSQLYVRCYWQDQPTGFDALQKLAPHAEYEVASIIMLEKMRDLGKQHPHTAGGCSPATDQEISDLYKALLGNPRYVIGSTRARLAEYIAVIAVDQRDLDTAMHYYDMAFELSGSPLYPFWQATLLQSAGLIPEALQRLDQAEAALKPRQRLQLPELAGRITALRKTMSSRGSP